MFASLLIANRGEIAVRIARTAQRLGMRVIAVHSAADHGAYHVRVADEAVEIGPAPAADSYLRIDRIIEAARASGAEAIHPGYGFLSENAAFAEACAAAGIAFVGPPPAAIRAMGLKDEAKTLMRKAGVPIVPGYHGSRQEPDFLREKAYEIGYPVLIKAVAGGGGKGMRRVDKQIEFDAALAAARREAEGSFGDPRVMIERFVPSPRHIEMQILADAHGNVIHLFERDCSLQRRHQKVIEEAPAPGMTGEVRAAMGAAAVAAAKAVGYVGAGTVEFIADAGNGLKADAFHFMEMNTRLQVEHPVTEAVTGLDLVEWQLRIAGGEKLPLAQEDIRLDGHAVEARLYAEDPDAGFLPSTGRIEVLEFGGEVRVDAGVEEGDEVTPFYDPMIAKLIAHGVSREEARERLSAALSASLVAGPRSNLGFLRRLLEDPDFCAGTFDTGLIDRRLAALTGRSPGFDEAATALGALRLIEREQERLASADGWPDPWGAADGFQLGGARSHGLAVTRDGQVVTIDLIWQDGGPTVVVPEGADWPELEAVTVDAEEGVYVIADGRQCLLARRTPTLDEAAAPEGEVTLRVPMHGRVVAVEVAPGDAVTRGQGLAVVEAMKMEHVLTAPADGTVTEVAAAPGDQLREGQALLVIRAGG